MNFCGSIIEGLETAICCTVYLSIIGEASEGNHMEDAYFCGKDAPPGETKVLTCVLGAAY